MSLAFVVFVENDAARQAVVYGVRFFSGQLTGPSARRGWRGLLSLSEPASVQNWSEE